MKHYLRFSLMLLLIMLMGGVSFAQTTVEQKTFTAVSADNINGDKNVSYSTAKGGGTGAPLIKDGVIQLYQNSGGTGGGTITISVATGYKINSITIGSSMTTSVAYTLDTETTKSTTASLSAGGKYSVDNIDVSSITFYCMGKTKTTRLYVNYLSVTYNKAGGSDKTNTTLSFPDLTSKTLLVGETFTTTPTLKAGETEVTGKTLTYKSSDEDVATVSDKGVVEAKKPGNTTITASFAGDDTYSASSASYSITVAANDIATLKSNITSTSTTNPQSFTLKLTDAVVTYTNNNTAYIQDASGAIYIYASKHGLDANQKINGFADVKACKYRGLNEITTWTLADDATVTDDGTFTVETVTLADLTNNFDKYESMPVKVAGATVTKDFVSKSGEISQDGTTFVVYNKGTSSVTLGSVGDNIDIIGYPAIYSTTKQLYLWKQSDITKNSSKIATTMAFSESEIKVASGSKDVTTPTLSLKTGDKDILTGKTITYSSTDEDVAMVDEEGTVVLMGKEGSTVITATFAGDDTYIGATASYTLTVYSSKVATTMAFSESEVKVAVGSEDVTTPTLTLTANGEDILTGKTITYSSTDEEVAMVDETAGTVVLMGKEGTTTITATFAGDDNYTSATASYTLTVYDPNKTDVTFDFSTMGYENAEVVNHVEKDGITLDLTKGGSYEPKYYTGNNTLRLYSNGGTLTVTAPTGKAIIKVDFALGKDITSSALKVNKGTITGTNSSYTWTGNSTSVVFTAGATIQMKELVISYTNVSDDSYDYALSDENDTYTPSTFTDKSVKIKRSLKANQLNTICLPFALTSEQISTTFGEGTVVYRLTSSTDNTMNFTSKETIEEGYPYLIMPQKDVNELIFDQVSSEGKSADLDVTDGDFALYGTFGPATLKTDGTELFLAAGGILKKPAQGSNSKIKGFRAYFSVPANTNDAKISLGGFETSIDNISIDGMKLKNNQVYNLNGQLVGNSLNGLAKGIYLMNGKKYVVK